MSTIYIPANGPEDWRQFLAEPDRQWKDGYSAKELATCWQNADGFPLNIKKIFNQSDIPLFNNIQFLIAIPEYKVPLPGGSQPSQNDIFVLAKGNGQLISIMVEGKVSEPFGPVVSEWIAEKTPGKEKRLEYLCKMIGKNTSDVMNIRYQLLHLTVSALIEAEKFTADNALMLVHSFSETDEWFEDYSNFAFLFKTDVNVNGVFSAGYINGINLYLGWVSESST